MPQVEQLPDEQVEQEDELSLPPILKVVSNFSMFLDSHFGHLISFTSSSLKTNFSNLCPHDLHLKS